MAIQLASHVDGVTLIVSISCGEHRCFPRCTLSSARLGVRRCFDVIRIVGRRLGLLENRPGAAMPDDISDGVGKE